MTSDVIDEATRRRFIDQLLICMIRRAGGRVVLPVEEIDATGGVILNAEPDANNNSFILELRSKH